VPAVLGAHASRCSELDLSVPTAAGVSVGESLQAGPARWPLGEPVTSLPAFMVVRGNLAPDGAVIKAAAASPSLLRHTGPAVVFHSYDEMRARIEDPLLDVSPDSVLVLAGCGPVGAGMPEWGNIPIPARLLAQGITDMLRVTDGRMSGTGFGTVVLHVAPESAVGGPLSRLRDGDMVCLDAYAGSLSVFGRSFRAVACGAVVRGPSRVAGAAPSACSAGAGGVRLRLPAGPDAGPAAFRGAGYRPVVTAL
jgi:dihydroxyacid dehydratase/phosphogluconate dehydratase